MDLDAMKTVFIEYFRVYSVTGVKIESIWAPADKPTCQWMIPVDTFQLSKEADRVVFTGFTPPRLTHWLEESVRIDAEVKLMFKTVTVDRFSAPNAAAMFELLKLCIPLKGSVAAVPVVAAVPAVPALVGSVSAAEQTNQILTIIKKTLFRIEKSLLDGKPK